LGGFVFHLSLLDFSFVLWWFEDRFVQVDDFSFCVNLLFTFVDPEFASVFCLTVVIGIIGGVSFEVCNWVCFLLLFLSFEVVLRPGYVVAVATCAVMFCVCFEVFLIGVLFCLSCLSGFDLPIFVD
jgi:hypothetical protein